MTQKEMGKIYILNGERLYLRTLQKEDRSDRYLGWLNDAEVQKYTRRRGKTSSMEDVDNFIEYSLRSPDFHFAIFTKDDHRHIGNASLNSVDEKNNSAEVSIMIGDRTAWGKGYGCEVIKFLSAFAFNDLKLHRLWAESCNPAFNILMGKLNWFKEGTRREAILIDGEYLDYTIWSILNNEQQKNKSMNMTGKNKLDKISMALFMTEGSPVGLKYLERMLENNFFPAMIILSRTRKLTALAISTVRQRTKNQFVWKEIGELLENKQIPVYYTDSHNSDATHQLLKKYNIDLAILGGTGIIKEKTLSIPGMGTINTHPGILPEYKGCSAVEWSLYNNDAVGATCHFVTPEIDAGDIIISIKAQITRGDDYYTVRLKAFELQSAALIAGLKILQRKDYKKFVKLNVGGNYYSPIGKKELKKAKNILSKQLYGHYSK